MQPLLVPSSLSSLDLQNFRDSLPEIKGVFKPFRLYLFPLIRATAIPVQCSAVPRTRTRISGAPPFCRLILCLCFLFRLCLLLAGGMWRTGLAGVPEAARSGQKRPKGKGEVGPVRKPIALGLPPAPASNVRLSGNSLRLIARRLINCSSRVCWHA